MMKKKLLARSVVLGLLCASIFGTSAWAERTYDINNTSPTTITFNRTDGAFIGAVDHDIIKIQGSGDHEINFNFNIGNSTDGYSFSSADFQISQNGTTGIYNDCGTTTTTTIGGNGLWINTEYGVNNATSIKNQSGILKINAPFILVSDKVENATGAKMEINGKMEVSVSKDDETVLSVGVVNKGIMNINGVLESDMHKRDYGIMSITDSLYRDYTSLNAIDNEGSLVGNVNYIHGNIMHHSGATTELNVTNDRVPTVGIFGLHFGLVQGNIIGSNSAFKMKLNSKTAWNPRQQVGAVDGIELNGGWIALNIDNYIFAQNGYIEDFNIPNWNTTYDIITLKDFKVISTSFSTSRDPYVFLRNSGGLALSTDLATEQGDKFIFTGTPVISADVEKIGVIIWDRNTTPQNMISEDQGKKVTIIEAPESSNMKFDAALGFNRNYESFRVYDPIILEETDGITHKWNFVGWQASAKSPGEESKQTWEDPYINVIELDNTLKRINDIRTDPSEVGVWLRGESGKMKIRSYSYDYNIMSGGYDWDFDSNAAKMFLGFGISYAKNDCDTGIIGNTKSMGYNLYGSWLGKENKDYVDVIVKYGTLDKDYAGLDDNNVFVKGDYDKNLFSIAAKYGRRIERADGWYWEPSVGLTWGRISSADYTDSQGIKIHADSSTSKMASLGVQVGKNIKGTEYYGKFEVRHDFDGKMHVSVPGSNLPGSSVYDDMGGTWYKVGIGAARKIDKNNSFYIDIEKDFGNKVKKPYSIGAGYRYTW